MTKKPTDSDPTYIKIHNNQAVFAYTPRFSEARSKPVIVIGNGSLLNLTFICRGEMLTEKLRAREGADRALFGAVQDSTLRKTSQVISVSADEFVMCQRQALER